MISRSTTVIGASHSVTVPTYFCTKFQHLEAFRHRTFEYALADESQGWCRYEISRAKPTCRHLHPWGLDESICSRCRWHTKMPAVSPAILV